jgi:hypothetical protein
VIGVFVIAIYNGACLYIEVFSKRYMKQFEKRQEMQAVAEAAARIALETAAALPEAEAAVNPQIPPVTEELARSAEEQREAEASTEEQQQQQQLQQQQQQQQQEEVPPPPPTPTPTPVISEDTKRLIQAATTEMIDRIMEERDELGAFRTQRMLDGIEPHPPGMLSDVMGVLGLQGMEYFDESLSSSESVSSSQSGGSLPTSRSCPDLQFYAGTANDKQEPHEQPRHHHATQSMGAAPTELRQRNVRRDA